MANFETKITLVALNRASGVIKNVAASLLGLKTSAALVRTSFSGLDTAFGNFGAAFRSYTLQAGLAGAAIVGLVKRNADYGEQLLNNAQKAGVSVESIQKLGYAATIAGIGADSMNNALKFLNKNMAEAASNPKSDAAKAFKSMGVAIKDASGKLRGADAILLDMSDTFKKNADGAAKVKTALTVAGRGGTEIIPVLNLGKKALIEQGKELQDLGGLMTKDMAERADAVGDTMQKIGFAFRGVSLIMSTSLIPLIESSVKGTLAYVKANEKVIASNMHDVVAGIASSLKVVRFALQTVHAILWPVIKAFGGLKMVITVISYVALASLMMKLGGVVVAFAAFTRSILLFNLALLATPLGWFIAGVAAIGAAVYLIYRNWKPISAFFSNLWERVKAIFRMSALDIVKNFGLLGVIFLPFIEGVKLAIAAVQALQSWSSKVSVKLNPATSGIPLDQPGALSSLNQTPVDFSSPRFGNASEQRLAPSNNQPQKLDIKMKIDADGKPKDITATSPAPLSFKSNVGLLMP